MGIRRMFIDRVWIQLDQPDDTAFLHDQGGQIMTRQEWHDLRAKVEAFYATTSDAEIEEHNEARREPPRKEHREPAPPPPKPSRAGYIYLLHGDGTPWYKIGQSEKPILRVSQLGTRAPFPIVMVTCAHVQDMDFNEKFWHMRFADKRAEGEWFLLTPDDIALFMENYNLEALS